MLTRRLFYLILILLVVGLVFVADVSAPQAMNLFNDKFFYIKQQLLWAGIGIAAMFLVSRIHYGFWRKLSIPLFLTSVVLLIIVLIPGLSLEALGARRWISIGSVNFQPSEVVKFTLALYLARLAETKNKKNIAYFFPIILVCGLIMLQPDLGTALMVGLIGISQVFISGVSILYFMSMFFGALVVILGLILVSPYRKDRLMTFLEITSDPLGKGYHIRQILLALGSGGFWGLGLGQSKQKYLFLPEASTDSIFAAISEEIGFVGSIIIILLFMYLVYLGFKIAFNSPDTFSKILAIGITTWIGGQAILNISAMVALAPLTGIPLPFFSYGGTSLSMILFSCGILLNISKYATQKTSSRR